MARLKAILFSVCLLALAQVSGFAQEAKTPAIVPAKEAKSKVGETITIEGKVAEVNKNEKIIRINLGARFPKQELTLVIFPANFSKFEDVEKLEGKAVRVTGKIADYQGRPQIVLDTKGQVKVQAESEPAKN